MTKVSVRIGWRLTFLGLLLILVLGSVLAYAALAITINGQPPDTTFNGWVAVVQKSTKASADQVQLRVLALTSGRQPLVAYIIGICGSQPFSGDLLIGQRAELSRTKSVPALPAAVQGFAQDQITPTPVHRFTQFGLADVSTTTPSSFAPTGSIGPVEVASFQASSPDSCSTGSSVANDVQAYVEGHLDQPITQNSNGPLGLWHGPNMSQAWPMIGTLPGASPGVDFSFNGDIGPALANYYWELPANEKMQAGFYSTPASWAVGVAQPAPASVIPLSWLSDGAIQPTARLTDSGSMNVLQDWIVVAGVGMGIGGSLLAGLVVEALRAKAARGAAIRHIHGPPPKGAAR
jgi:hypothetical protein